MTDDKSDEPGENTVSNEDWARIMGEEPEDSEDTAAAADSGNKRKSDNSGAADGADGPGKKEGVRTYEVGYKKPPKQTRFKKGRSGNPKGRPKKTLNLKTDIADEFSERVAIMENGRKKRVSKQRLMIKSLTAKAIKGDTKAATILINILARTLGLDPGSDEVKEMSAEDAVIMNEWLGRETGAGDG